MTPHLITQRFTTLSIFNINNFLCTPEGRHAEGERKKIVKCYPSIKHVQQCVHKHKMLNLKEEAL
jgi:hypothetical protein